MYLLPKKITDEIPKSQKTMSIEDDDDVAQTSSKKVIKSTEKRTGEKPSFKDSISIESGGMQLSLCSLISIPVDVY